MRHILAHDRHLVSELEDAGIGDEDIALVAYTHDLAQQPGIASPLRDARTDHSRRIAAIMQYAGRNHLGIDGSRLRLVTDALLEHDAVLEGKIVNTSNPLLYLLSDADKLYGAVVNDDPELLMSGALGRNRKGSFKVGGWHAMRRDLTIEDRLGWKYGARWMLDSLSAVLHETYRIHYFTQFAQEVARTKQNYFLECNVSLYSAELDSIMSVVGGDQQNLLPYEAVLSAEQKVVKNGALRSRGEYLKVGDNEEAGLIDPTIAHFLFATDGTYDPYNGVERMTHFLRNTVDAYTKEIAQIGGTNL
jgi:hypothetical protein